MVVIGYRGLQATKGKTSWDTLFKKLAALNPRRLAIMHGSSFEGDGARALAHLAAGFKEVFGRSGESPTDE